MARIMSPEEYQELGRRYYQLKQYEKAIDILTKGIEAWPTLALYDHRAAAYDKLENFAAAVKDSREMIKLDKKEVKGYLRTTKILEKLEKPEIALGIFKYGMKNVPVTDPNFKVCDRTVHYLYRARLTQRQLLQQLHDKLTRKLSPDTAKDPFTVLPVELAEMVLEYLSFRNMVNCMRVSKGWKEYLVKLPRLWMHLDLSGARKPVPRSFVGNAVRRSKARLTCLTVDRFEHVDVLKNIAKACKDLKELKINTLPHTMSSTLIDVVQLAPNLNKLVVHPHVSLNTATQILRHHRNLENVCFGGIQVFKYDATWEGPFTCLKTFSIDLVDQRSANKVALRSLLGQTPMLENLTIANMRDLTILEGWPQEVHQLPPLRTLVLRRIHFRALPPLPPTLRRLVIDYDGSFDWNNGLEATRFHSSELTELSLSGFDNISAALLDQMLDVYIDGANKVQELIDGAPLRSLSLSGVLNGNRDICSGLFRGSNSVLGLSPRILTPSLVTLGLARLPCDDDEIEELLTHDISNLKSIDISHTKITGSAIWMLVEKLPSLTFINANCCPKITSRDAIDYAERKGVEVSRVMVENKGGRKIRYG